MSATPSHPGQGGPTVESLSAVVRETDSVEAEIGLAERVVPWIVSLAAHGVMLVLGLLIPWTTAQFLADNAAPPDVTAEFSELTLQPLGSINPGDSNSEDLVFKGRSPLDRTAPVGSLQENRAAAASPLGSAGGENALAGFAPGGGSGGGGDALGGFAPRGGADSVTFGGLRGSNVHNIVYVVDASGSMIAYLPILIDELTRSIDKLNESQNFRVVFFQKNEAVLVPGPQDSKDIATKRRRGTVKLLPATNENKLFVFDWMNLDNRNIRAASQSNPLAALELALRDMNPVPDVVFILSTDITGLGEFEVDQRDLLNMIERLNRGKNGQLHSVLKAIQFIYEDPLETLRRIAEENGGPDGYRFLSRQELGLDR